MLFRLFVTALICVFAGSVSAQVNLRDEFNFKQISGLETRILQGAMAFEGQYSGIIDGEWGRASTAALSKVARARHNARRVNWQHVAALHQRFEREVKQQNWRPEQVLGMSFQSPTAFVTERSARKGRAFISRDRGLQIRVVPQTLAEALTLANAITARHVGKDKPYQLAGNNRLIVSAETGGGAGVYMRTHEASGKLATVLVEWSAAQASRARLVIASIRNGRQRALIAPQNGTLATLLRPTPQTGTTVTKPSRPSVFGTVKIGRNGRSVGNAFFVNNTDLITTASVLKGCKSVSIAGLGAAKIVKLDSERDLALLMSDNRSDTWVDVPRTFPEQSDRLMVVGFDSRAARQGSAHPLSAEIVLVKDRATREHLVGKLHLENSFDGAAHGSVVLDNARKFAGLIVRHPNPTPETRNAFLASAEYLRGFLRDNNVMFSRGGRNGAAEMSEQMLQKTMWPVACVK